LYVKLQLRQNCDEFFIQQKLPPRTEQLLSDNNILFIYLLGFTITMVKTIVFVILIIRLHHYQW